MKIRKITLSHDRLKKEVKSGIIPAFLQGMIFGHGITIAVAAALGGEAVPWWWLLCICLPFYFLSDILGEKTLENFIKNTADEITVESDK
jgi:hypothetical protein